MEDELTFHYKDEDFESIDDFEEPIDVWSKPLSPSNGNQTV